jgi:hypothetical protein
LHDAVLLGLRGFSILFIPELDIRSLRKSENLQNTKGSPTSVGPRMEFFT